MHYDATSRRTRTYRYTPHYITPTHRGKLYSTNECKNIYTRESYITVRTARPGKTLRSSCVGMHYACIYARSLARATATETKDSCSPYSALSHTSPAYAPPHKFRTYIRRKRERERSRRSLPLYIRVYTYTYTYAHTRIYTHGGIESEMADPRALL